jgi:hypothetical protein
MPSSKPPRALLVARRSATPRSETAHFATARPAAPSSAMSKVDGFTRSGRLPLVLWGSVFKHVTLRGKIGFFKLALTPDALNMTPAYVAAWRRANVEFYERLDWALDIVDAQFSFAPDLHFVPGHLVRRDPRTQLLVTREQAREALQSSLPWGNSSLRVALSWFLHDGPYESTVVVAAKATATFADELAAMELLRGRGLAV